MPSDVELSTAQRVVEAAAVLPPQGAVTGWAALHWLGGRWFGGVAGDGKSLLPVPLVIGTRDIRPQPGFRLSAERLARDDVRVVDGLPITSAARSVCFEMRHAKSLWQAVAVLDMAAYSDLVSIDEMVVFALAHPGWTGIPQCRMAVALADENSWSPMETWLRLVWVLVADLRAPRCNVPVFDREGRLVGTPDLLDEEAGVAGEYDGTVHLTPTARHRDEQRLDGFRDVGLEVVTALAADAGDRDRLARRLIAARQRAKFAPPDARAWTLEKPDWWRPTETVAQRRALSPEERRSLLAHRLG